MNRLDSDCPVQLSAEGKAANGVAIWPQLAHAVPLWLPLESPSISWWRYDFSPAIAGRRSSLFIWKSWFQSSPLTWAYSILFSCSVTLYSPLHKQMGISKKLISNFLAEVQSPPPAALQSFWQRNGQFMTAKLSEHTSAHIYPWQFLLTRWEVFLNPCLIQVLSKHQTSAQ